VAYHEDTSTATATYNGTITKNNNANNAVRINAKSSGATAFGGAITASTSSANAIDLTNTGGTVNFTGGLNLTTTSGVAFNATGSGATVNATQDNSSIVNTLTTTTGTALNVANTTIGASGLTFRSISSNGAVNGISLNTTGSTGGLTVSGNGGTCTSVGTCTGGTIQSAAVGVSLNSTRGVSIDRMFIQNTSDSGINGTSVTNFTFTNGKIDNSGNAGFESNIAFNGTGSQAGNNIAGTLTVTGNTLTNAFYSALDIQSDNGTVTNANISDNTITNTGGLGINISGVNNASTVFNLNNATINQNNITQVGGTGIQAQCSASNVTGPGAVCGTPGDPTKLISITNNTVLPKTTATQAITVANSGGNSGSRTKTNFLVQCNGKNTGGCTSPTGTALGSSDLGTVILIGNNGFADMTGTVNNNAIVATHTPNLGGGNGIAGGNGVAGAGNAWTPHLTLIVTNNSISGTDGNGILLVGRGTSGFADMKIANNNVGAPVNAGGTAREGIRVDAGNAASADDGVCLNIFGNTSAGSNGAAGIGIRKQGVVQTTNDFGITGLSPSPATGLQAASFVATNNPGSAGGVDAISGNNFQSCGTAPALPETAKTAQQPDRASMATSFVASTSEPAAINVLTPAPAHSAETASPSNSTVAVSKSLDLNKSKRDAGNVLRYSARDTFAPLVSRPMVARQGKRARGVVSIPRISSPSPLTNAGPINIGTLRPGDSVTITFQVTVNNPYLGGPNVSNQGVVSGSNFSSVLTDDPAVGGTSDPTLTPIALPVNINVSDAQANEPASGSTPMLFTVSLSAPAPGGGVTVHYSTADQAPGPGHAVAGSDYTAVPDTVLTFTSGQQFKTVSVNILSEAIPGEPDETFLLNLSSATGGNIMDGQGVGTIKQGSAAGTFLISELRTSGPGGPGDDFVEFYNNTDSPLTVTSSDATAGYGLFKMGADCNAAPILIGTIPNATVIPARGHYLMVGSAYSLGTSATGDQVLSADVDNDANVGVFSTANVNNISSVNRLDAVGFGTNSGGGICDLLREGTNLPALSGSTLQYSFERDQCGKGGNPGVFGTCPTSTPVDTNNNNADFLFADTTGANTIAGQRLGAPGPENLASPIQRNNTIAAVLLDATQAAAAVPNRVRDLTNSAPPNTNHGTLSIRRRFVNNTGANITRLRFRVIDITSFPTPGGIADLRALTSANVIVSGINDSATCLASTGSAVTPCTITVQGTTLEPPIQTMGGALNSTLAAGTITLGTPLANGASVNVQFLLGVQATGSFKIYVNIEALP